MLVEIVVRSGDDAVAAERGGAHRLELCTALGVGGLTPSVGLVRSVRARTELPIMAMVRPREGGFDYTAAEFDAMEWDVETLLQAGADGVVLAVLRPDGRIDVERCRRLVERAAGKPVACHRAFDATPDPFDSLETLIDLGFTRVLTGGGVPKAIEGVSVLRELIERAAGRIEVMPGGGIRSENVREIVETTGANQVHLAPLSPREDLSGTHGGVRFGGYQGIEEAEVARVVAACYGEAV
ncbi:MAG: copper homeostasis protein CutC [Fimbriimonas sp.]